MTIILRGRTVCKGIAEGEALVCRKPFMFLSYTDLTNGTIYIEGHELAGKNAKGKIMVFPCGCGSTAEEWSLYVMKKAGVAPKAIITGSAVYTPSVVGAIIADVPMVCGFDEKALGLIETGDHVKVDANKGVIEVTKVEA